MTKLVLNPSPLNLCAEESLNQIEKKAVESNFLCIETGEEEDDQLMVLYLRMKRAVISTNKVTFILFSVHWLYNFSKKSITDHHTRRETE